MKSSESATTPLAPSTTTSVEAPVASTSMPSAALAALTRTDTTPRLTRVVLPAGVVLLAASCVVAILLGAGHLPPGGVARSIASHLGWGTTPLSRLADSVVWQLRVPRTLLAAVVGASLAVCGVVLQALTRNVLADPYLLGVSSGASAGAVAVLVLGWGGSVLGQSAGAFVGGLLAFTLVMALSGSGTASSMTRIVLVGVAVGQLGSAATSLVLTVSGDADTLRGITFWLLGSLSGARWPDVGVCAAALALGTVLCWSQAGALDAFTFGGDAAAALGIPVGRVRAGLLVVTALMTAASVATVGAIGFVGLVLPHLVRRLVGARHRRLIPTAALTGAVFLVWVDLAARTVFAPQEVPVGVVTALIGVPVFLLVLRSRTRVS